MPFSADGALSLPETSSVLSPVSTNSRTLLERGTTNTALSPWEGRSVAETFTTPEQLPVPLSQAGLKSSSGLPDERSATAEAHRHHDANQEDCTQMSSPMPRPPGSPLTTRRRGRSPVAVVRNRSERGTSEEVPVPSPLAGLKNFRGSPDDRPATSGVYLEKHADFSRLPSSMPRPPGSSLTSGRRSSPVAAVHNRSEQGLQCPGRSPEEVPSPQAQLKRSNDSPDERQATTGACHRYHNANQVDCSHVQSPMPRLPGSPLTRRRLGSPVTVVSSQSEQEPQRPGGSPEEVPVPSPLAGLKSSSGSSEERPATAGAHRHHHANQEDCTQVSSPMPRPPGSPLTTRRLGSPVTVVTDRSEPQGVSPEEVPVPSPLAGLQGASGPLRRSPATAGMHRHRPSTLPAGTTEHGDSFPSTRGKMSPGFEAGRRRGPNDSVSGNHLDETIRNTRQIEQQKDVAGADGKLQQKQHPRLVMQKKQLSQKLLMMTPLTPRRPGLQTKSAADVKAHGTLPHDSKNQHQHRPAPHCEKSQIALHKMSEQTSQKLLSLAPLPQKMNTGAQDQVKNATDVPVPRWNRAVQLVREFRRKEEKKRGHALSSSKRSPSTQWSRLTLCTLVLHYALFCFTFLMLFAAHLLGRYRVKTSERSSLLRGR